MAENQYAQQPKKTDTFTQKQTTPTQTASKMQLPSSHPMAIIQRARINPKSLTHADIMQLQRTIGNRAVGRLLSEIGLIPSKPKQALPVQMQTIPEEEKEPLQGEMAEAIQRQETPEEEEPLQGKFVEPIQRQEIPEEEKPLQGIFKSEPEQVSCPSCSTSLIQKQEENRTGMPDNLKVGVENLSGIDMSDVKVHYNSSKPAEVGALAYTQGTNIHIAPGQEKYLPHEAWHVVQQKQERVKPTMQLKGTPVNDDLRLEQEADEMGEMANEHILQQHRKIRNRYIAQHLSTKRIIQRGREESQDNPPSLTDGSSKKVSSVDLLNPAIGVLVKPGDEGLFGYHATIYLAKRKNDHEKTMIYYKIDLVAPEEKGVEIRIIDITEKEWPPVGDFMSTWRIGHPDAEYAYQTAVKFQTDQKTYQYSTLGIGWRKHNCASFAERILRAAGVNRTAGLFISTPSELLLGRKFGDKRFGKKYKGEG